MTVCAETSDERESRQVTAAVRIDLEEKDISGEKRQCKKVALLFCFE